MVFFVELATVTALGEDYDDIDAAAQENFCQQSISLQCGVAGIFLISLLKPHKSWRTLWTVVCMKYHCFHIQSQEVKNGGIFFSDNTNWCCKRPSWFYWLHALSYPCAFTIVMMNNTYIILPNQTIKIILLLIYEKMWTKVRADAFWDPLIVSAARDKDGLWVYLKGHSMDKIRQSFS